MSAVDDLIKHANDGTIIVVRESSEDFIAHIMILNSLEGLFLFDSLSFVVLLLFQVLEYSTLYILILWPYHIG